MKKVCNILEACAVTAALLLAASCSKESGTVVKEATVDADAPEGWSGYKVRIEDLTKTYLTADNRVAWMNGDRIRVVGATSVDLAVEPAGPDATEAFVLGTMPAESASGSRFKAFYPAEMATVSGDAVTLKLPETREYATNESPLLWCPMYAESNDNYFTFRNLCGMLEINARGTGKVKKIEVLSTDATSGLMSGTFSINASGNAVINVGDADAGRKTILSFTNSVPLSDKGVKFYVALPVGTYKNLIIRFFDDDGKVSGARLAGNLTVVKGQVYMADTGVSFNEGVQLWEDGPYWATKNVGATAIEDPGTYYQYGSTVKIYSDWLEKPAFSPWPTAADYKVYFIPKPEYSGGWCTATANLLGLPDIRAKAYDPLPAKYDAVVKNMGEGWHIALYDDFDNLKNKCDFRYVDSLGTFLWIATGRGDFAGKSIVLPTTGFGNLDGAHVEMGYFTRVLLWSSKAIGANKDGWSFEINMNPAKTATNIIFKSWTASSYVWAWPYRGATY